MSWDVIHAKQHQDFCGKTFAFVATHDQYEHTCTNPMTKKRVHQSQQVLVGTVLQPTNKHDPRKIMESIIVICQNGNESRFKHIAENCNVKQSSTVSTYFYDIFASVCAISMSQVGTLGSDFTDPYEFDGYHEATRYFCVAISCSIHAVT